MFSVKEVSKNLGVSSQAIYNQKEKLISLGYMYKNSFGNWRINENGYNYLHDKTLNKFNKHVENKSLNNSFQNTNLSDKDVQDNSLNFNSTCLINLYENMIKEMKENYENQLQEQKQQIEYFKNLYEKEKAERIHVFSQYQTYMLGTSEQNLSFFKRISKFFGGN